MSEEPAPYRAGPASFELHFGSALKAILPGAFQGSVVGSLLVAAYFAFTYITDGGGLGASDIIGMIMMFCFVMMIGTLAGMVVCAMYIALVGLPLALLMRRRIATTAMLIVTLLVATICGVLISQFALVPFVGVEDQEPLLTVLALAYALPAGVAYRQSIITERMLSFWSTDAD